MAVQSKSVRKAAKNVTAAVDQKIRDQRLMRFAEGESSRTRTVLLRVDVPQPKLSIGRRRKIGRETLPRRKLNMSKADLNERNSTLTAVAKQLRDAGVENKTLSSGTIIAKVLPTQLRTIADSKHIKSIIPNRKYSY